jgi:hypothetical protein
MTNEYIEIRITRTRVYIIKYSLLNHSITSINWKVKNGE